MHDSGMLLMPQHGAMTCQFVETAAQCVVCPGEAPMVAPRVTHRTVSEGPSSRHLTVCPAARRLSDWMMAKEAFRIMAAPAQSLRAYHPALPFVSARPRAWP
jgi:hypothetical protein